MKKVREKVVKRGKAEDLLNLHSCKTGKLKAMLLLRFLHQMHCSREN